MGGNRTPLRGPSERVKCTLIRRSLGQLDEEFTEPLDDIPVGAGLLEYWAGLTFQTQQLRAVMKLVFRLQSEKCSVPAVQLFCRQVGRLLQAAHVSVYQITHRSQRLVPIFACKSKSDSGMSKSLASSLSADKAADSMPTDINLAEAFSPEHNDELCDRSAMQLRLGSDETKERYRLLQVIRTPEGEPCGIIQLISSPMADAFSADQIAMLDFFAPFIAPLITSRAGASSARLNRPAVSNQSLQQLLELVGGVAQELEIQPLILQIRKAAKEAMQCEKCTVFLVDHEQQILTGRFSDEEGGRTFTLPIQHGVAGYVATSGEAVNLKDAYSDKRFDPTIDTKMAHTTKTMLCTPIYSKDGCVIGVLQFLNKREGFDCFSSEDEELMSSFCSLFSICLLNSEVFEKEKAVRWQKEALLELAQAVSSKLELAPLVRTIRQAACRVMRAERCTIFIRQSSLENGEAKDVLVFRLSEEEGATLHAIPVGQGVAGHCAASGETVNIADAYTDQRFDQTIDRRTKQSTACILAAPLHAHVDENSFGRNRRPSFSSIDQIARAAPSGGNRVIGCIQMINKRGGPFLQEDERLLKAIAGQLSIAITNAMLYKSQLESRQYLEAVLACSDDYVFSISNDGLLKQSNKPLHTIFPGATEAVMRSSPCEVWMGGSQTSRGLVADIEHVLSEGDNVQRSGVKLGVSKRGGVLVDYKVTTLMSSLESSSLPLDMGLYTGEDDESDIISAVQATRKRGAGNTGTSDKIFASAGQRGPNAPCAPTRLGVLVVLTDRSEVRAIEKDLSRVKLDNDLMRDLMREMMATKGPRESRPSVDVNLVPFDVLRRQVDKMLRGETDPSQQMQQLRTIASLLGPDSQEKDDADGDANEKQLDSWKHAAQAVSEVQPDSIKELEAIDVAGISFLDFSADFGRVPAGDVEMLIFPVRMFYAAGVVHAFSIKHEALLAFVSSIRDTYLDNPYHCFAHAVNVMHKTFLVVCKTRLWRYLTRLDMLALLLASLAHDAGHLGRTNSFEVASESPLAIQHNNVSCNEHNHAATLFRVLDKHNILGSFTRPQRLHLRQGIINCVLCTDLSQHGKLRAAVDDLCSACCGLIATPAASPHHSACSYSTADRASSGSTCSDGDRGTSAEESSQGGRRSSDSSARATDTSFCLSPSTVLASLLSQAVLVLADLSTPALPWTSTVAWVRRLQKEMTLQTELEAKIGIPQSLGMLASTSSKLAMNEMGFIKHMVLPLWMGVAKLFPQLLVLVRMIENNLDHWMETEASGEKPETLAAAAAAVQEKLADAWSKLPILFRPAELEQSFN